uniref:Maelstrom domain-containing protein n=1 Tax=Steinernema glaseri TaxID=37863 RepID=A0A1I7ZAR6_9BILA
MDRVPICFIEEVLLQLEDTPRFKNRKYPSIWGEVADKKLTRKNADLHIYLESKEKVFFCVYDDDGPVGLDRIGQFVLENIEFEDILDEDWNATELPKFHPLTKKNFQRLHNVFRKPFPCSLELDFQTDPIHPLVQRLCLAIPRVAELRLASQVPLCMDILTRSIERGTLRFLCCQVDVTQEMLPVLLKFVTSEKMDKFEAKPSDDSPISYETLLNVIVDAVLTRKRGCRVLVADRCRHLCDRLNEEVMREKVKVIAYYSWDRLSVRCNE